MIEELFSDQIEGIYLLTRENAHHSELATYLKMSSLVLHVGILQDVL